MAKNPSQTAGTDRLELLQTPFNIRLYGRPVSGVTIARDHLNGRIGERSDAQALKKVVRQWSRAKKGDQQSVGLAEAAAIYQDAEQTVFALANVYGYVQGTSRVLLPRPVTFLVDDDGGDAWGWDELFPFKDKSFRCWEVDPQEVTLRFDTRQGSFDELLLRGQMPDQPLAGVGEPEGGTLIRGADNRLYLIPLALEPFEVKDEGEKSQLLIEAPAGREIKVDRMHALTGRSTLVARSTLTVRSTLTLRSTLAAAANR